MNPNGTLSIKPNLQPSLLISMRKKASLSSFYSPWYSGVKGAIKKCELCAKIFYKPTCCTSNKNKHRWSPSRERRVYWKAISYTFNGPISHGTCLRLGSACRHDYNQRPKFYAPGNIIMIQKTISFVHLNFVKTLELGSETKYFSTIEKISRIFLLLLKLCKLNLNWGNNVLKGCKEKRNASLASENSVVLEIKCIDD